MIVSIILAAGESRRMGFPKLSLTYQGKTLLEHAILNAKQVSSAVLVITGAYPDIYGPLAKNAGAQVIENPNWQEGLGSSLRTGINALPLNTDACLVLLGDQPFIESSHLEQLIETQKNSNAELIFSAYNGIQGPPVLIQNSLFEAANYLKGEKGAKALVKEGLHIEIVTLSDYLARDIDTPDDQAKLS